jgi:hypothetical protein
VSGELQNYILQIKRAILQIRRAILQIKRAILQIKRAILPNATNKIKPSDLDAHSTIPARPGNMSLSSRVKFLFATLFNKVSSATYV